MKHPWTAFLALLPVAAGCGASTEQCDAAFEASVEIAARSFRANNPAAPERLVVDLRTTMAEKRKARFLKTCASRSPAVAECMAAATTVQAHKGCVPE